MFKILSILKKNVQKINFPNRTLSRGPTIAVHLNLQRVKQIKEKKRKKRLTTIFAKTSTTKVKTNWRKEKMIFNFTYSIY